MAKQAVACRPGIRRFLRFSLRSLMLVTLVVAAWLGYEVHQARTVAGQAKAIRGLGGDVDFEPSPWSLLRFEALAAYSSGALGAWALWPRYQSLSLPDGSIAEVLLLRAQSGLWRRLEGQRLEYVGDEGTIEHVILLVEDRCVAAKTFTGRRCLYGTTSIETADDGNETLNVEMFAPLVWKDEYRVERRESQTSDEWYVLDPMPELRSIKAVYAIEAAGFRCLSGDDPFPE